MIRARLTGILDRVQTTRHTRPERDTAMTKPSPASFRIAAIAGDGIGNEVLPEGLRVVEAAARKFNLPIEVRRFNGPTATTTCATAR
ncbi:hypothetical protein LMG23994_03197 [Cupriavidus pinatubonensis]|uniref:Isopropylmalate dehydrogenase-like domain-containing protein n=1 Tax=Cupriavidus pinatubonensis TaxID=248026 RepID=A0ABM8X755_9BURK|nr:hypothetical protein LMG23994_03197 [Cupriavidus pinatubonensis]